MHSNSKPAADFERNFQFYKFCAYGFLKNLRFYEPFLMLFFLEKGLTFLQIGTLYAAREVSINIVEIPSGVIADSLGRKRSMAVSFMFYILSFIVFFFAESYWVLFAAMLVYAGGDAFRTGTHKAMIFEYLHMHGWGHLKTHYYGHTRAWSQAGAALSALIAAFLVFWRGSYAPVFLFTIIPYVLDLMLVLSYPPELDGPRHTSDKTIASEFVHVIRSLLKSLRNPDLIRAIANQSLYSGYYKAFKDYLQPILKSFAVGLPVLLALEGDQRTAIITGVVYAPDCLCLAVFRKAFTAVLDTGNPIEPHAGYGNRLWDHRWNRLLVGSACGCDTSVYRHLCYREFEETHGNRLRHRTDGPIVHGFVAVGGIPSGDLVRCDNRIAAGTFQQHVGIGYGHAGCFRHLSGPGFLPISTRFGAQTDWIGSLYPIFI